MKRWMLVMLGVSLAGNLALLFAPPWVAAVTGAREVSAIRGDGTGPRASATAAEPAEARVGGPAEVAGAAIGHWDAIESADLAAVRERLRAAGFPEEYVRMIVWSRIQRRNTAAHLAALGGGAVPPFWLPRDAAADRARHAGLRDLDRAMRDEFRTYFSEGMGDAMRLRHQQARLSFLPADKVEAVTRIDADYAELTGQVRTEMVWGIQLEEDRRKLALLEQNRRADLAAVLTPEELELYELHTSSTARSVRSRLAYFEPTEEEFRAIFALQRAFDEEFGPMYGQPSQEELRRRSGANQEMRRQVANVLGPARAAEYERATSYSYMAAAKIVDHFQLPRETAATVYGLESEYQRRRNEAMRASIEPQQRTDALRALAAEAAERVDSLLGEEGARAYRETGGYWLRNLEQQAERTAVARP